MWCAAPAVSHAVAEVAKSGAGFQTARPTGSFGSGAAGGTSSTWLATSRNRSRRSVRATTTPGAGVGGEDEADGVLAAADGEGVNLQAGAGGGEGGADLEHVRAEDALLSGGEVVGVVLHERGAAGQAGAHDLGGADEDGGLPVALGAEAVAVGHQPLHGEAGELAQAAEVLEAGGERAEPAGVEEGPQAELDRRAVPQRLVPLAAGEQLGRDVVAVGVLVDELVDARPWGPRPQPPPGR